MTNDKKIGIRFEKFDISEETDEGVTATGFALPFHKESRNGVIYDKESVIENKETLEGLPVLWNHDELRPPLGHVEEVETKEDGLYFEMNLDPKEEEILRKIERGDVKNVSIQAMVDETNETDEGALPVEEFLELSVCTIAGFPETTISAEKYAESLESNEEDKSKEPFAGFDDWDDCMDHMTNDQGYDKDTAEQVCGDLKDKYENATDEESESDESNSNSNNGENMTEDEQEVEEENQEAKEQDNMEERLDAVEEAVEEIRERLSALETKIEQEEKEAEEEKEEAEEETTEEEVQESKQQVESETKDKTVKQTMRNAIKEVKQ